MAVSFSSLAVPSTHYYGFGQCRPVDEREVSVASRDEPWNSADITARMALQNRGVRGIGTCSAVAVPWYQRVSRRPSTVFLSRNTVRRNQYGNRKPNSRRLSCSTPVFRYTSQSPRRLNNPGTFSRRIREDLMVTMVVVQETMECVDSVPS